MPFVAFWPLPACIKYEVPRRYGVISHDMIFYFEKEVETPGICIKMMHTSLFLIKLMQGKAPNHQQVEYIR
jgi:hypothetical protein